MYRPHERVQLHPGPGRTKQSFAKESNINLIMAKYEKTGLLDHLNKHEGNYGNFIGYADYHTSMNQIQEAADAFQTIPAGVRAKFSNDPAKFLEFAQNPENIDELIEMGLARPKSPTSEAPPEPEKAPTATNVPVEPPPSEQPTAPS